MSEYPDPSRDLRAILHPYLFVLREGLDIQADYLDYSLLMLHVSPPEVIQSPGSVKTMNLLPAALMLSEQHAYDNRHASTQDF